MGEKYWFMQDQETLNLHCLRQVINGKMFSLITACVSWSYWGERGHHLNFWSGELLESNMEPSTAQGESGWRKLENFFTGMVLSLVSFVALTLQ
jgi:hypothetical protein